ncbi:MAG: CDP-2,3-bis-(O-geranylgeranyl)-sn-glycerol synthase [Candidatus Diapherotrites archaeon]
MADLWTTLILTAIPLYVANASAMVFGGKTPLDMEKKWMDGRRLLGKGKTWKGTGMGILIGTFTGFSLAFFFPTYTESVSSHFVAFAFLLSVGALTGDMIGSFIKRRMGMESGKPAHVLDQLDFVLGGILFSLGINPPNWTVFLLLIMITPFMHLTFNRIAYITGIKGVPW